MTSDVRAVCALTGDRRGKGKHVGSARCRSQEREAGESACGESADGVWSNDAVPAEGDSQVTELLQFVNLISSDVKVALSRSPRSKRHVDHRKYLQRQLSKLSSVPSESFVLQNIRSPENKWRSCMQKGKHREYAVFGEMTSYEEDIKQLDSKSVGKSWETLKMLSDSRDAKTTELSSTQTQDMYVEVPRGLKMTSENCTDQAFKKKDMFGSLEGHFQRQSSKVKQMYSPANCYKAGTFYPGEVFQKQDVPLRQRQLPASFWQEPNVPRFHFDNACFHGFCFNLQEQTQSYKAFLERLQTAQRHRIDGFGSQFPITDFLYHKYGIKDSLSSYPYTDFLPLQHHYPSELKTLGAYPALSGTAHVHPYVESVFPSASPELPNRSCDFVLGKMPSGLDVLHTVCKPIATKTSHTDRYHPFRESP